LNYKKMPKPSNYGEWWEKNDRGLEWYKEIYESRKAIHLSFQRWVAEVESVGKKIESILELGCGRAIGYSDLFLDRRYVGYDVSTKEVAWCKKNRQNPRHAYIAGDFLEKGIEEKFELVFSHALIDHIYDINAFILAMVVASKKWVYITSYRGWFPDLKEHNYMWNERDTCYYNHISPNEVRRILIDAQLTNFLIAPLATNNPLIPNETVIIIRV
jgi:SAM-dependent methyltransferase